MRAIRKSAPAWFWRLETGFKVNFEESWKILYLEGVLKGPRWFLCYLERQGVGKTNESRSRSFLVGRIWIETSLDVYYRVRNEENKAFRNIEIWWLLPVTVYCAFVAKLRAFLAEKASFLGIWTLSWLRRRTPYLRPGPSPKNEKITRPGTQRLIVC